VFYDGFMRRARRKQRQEDIAGVAPPLYYRSHADWIAHLAVIMSQSSEHQIKHRMTADNDLARASQDDVDQAYALLKRAGIRTTDESPPAWHFAHQPFSRGAAE
jgi:hypothetical protein